MALVVTVRATRRSDLTALSARYGCPAGSFFDDVEQRRGGPRVAEVFGRRDSSEPDHGGCLQIGFGPVLPAFRIWFGWLVSRSLKVVGLMSNQLDGDVWS